MSAELAKIKQEQQRVELDRQRFQEMQQAEVGLSDELQRARAEAERKRESRIVP